MLLNSTSTVVGGSSSGGAAGSGQNGSKIPGTSNSFKNLPSTSSSTINQQQQQQGNQNRGYNPGGGLMRTNGANGSTTQLPQPNTRSATTAGHFRTRSFSSTTTTSSSGDDPYHYHQNQGFRNAQPLPASFTPPDTFDLMDYELLLMQHKKHIESQQTPSTVQGGTGTPNKYGFQLQLPSSSSTSQQPTSSTTTTPRGGMTTPRNNGSTTPRASTATNQPTTPRGGGPTTPRGGPTTPRGGSTTPQRDRNRDDAEEVISEDEVPSTPPEEITARQQQQQLLANKTTNVAPVVTNPVDSLFYKVPTTMNNVNNSSTNPAQDSQLTVELKPRRNNPLTTGLMPDSLASRQIMANSMVRYIATFVPHKRGGVHKVNVPIQSGSSQNFSASDLIRKALELYKRETNLEPMALDERAYQLRVAEEDGLPDTSWPPLNKEKTMIEQLGNVKLVLVYDRDFQPLLNGVFGTNSEEESSSGNLRSRKDQQLNIKFGGEEVFTKFNLEDIRLQVFLPPSNSSCSTPTSINAGNPFMSPNNTPRTHQITFFKLVPVSPELLLKDLQKVLCQRFNLNPKKYSLNIMGKDNVVREISKNYRDKTLYSLGSMIERVVLARIAPYENETDGPTQKGEVSGSPIQTNLGVGSPPPNFAFPLLPFDNTDNVYNVIKTNKFGVRQERILSFDSDQIYNSKPSSTSKFFPNSNKTKHPTRPITSLRHIECDTANPKCFTLVFDDENLYYEAKTAVESETIVKRLEHLLLVKKHPIYTKNRNSFSIARVLSDLTPRRH